MGERGVAVDHSTIFRWVQTYAPEIEKRLRWQWRRRAPPKCIFLSLLAPGPAAEVSPWRRQALSVTFCVTRGSREPRPPLAKERERG